MAKKVTKKTSPLTAILARAKEIRIKNPKLEWKKCVKKASSELKKEGKI